MISCWGLSDLIAFQKCIKEINRFEQIFCYWLLNKWYWYFKTKQIDHYFKGVRSVFLLICVWIRHFTLKYCLQTPVFSARNHNAKTAETHWNLFGLKSNNNLIDCLNSRRLGAFVGEVLLIKKLMRKAWFSPGLVFFKLWSTVSQHLKQ